VTAYRVFGETASLHRLKYETDPASPREPGTVEKSKPPVFAGRLNYLLDCLGLPGNAHHYIEFREWFRDSYTRLYHNLHFGLLAYERDDPHWFEHHPHPRQMKTGFWQHSGDTDAGVVSDLSTKYGFPKRTVGNPKNTFIFGENRWRVATVPVGV